MALWAGELRQVCSSSMRVPTSLISLKLQSHPAWCGTRGFSSVLRSVLSCGGSAGHEAMRKPCKRSDQNLLPHAASIMLADQPPSARPGQARKAALCSITVALQAILWTVAPSSGTTMLDVMILAWRSMAVHACIEAQTWQPASPGHSPIQSRKGRGICRVQPMLPATALKAGRSAGAIAPLAPRDCI